jgi:hypothetical protein
VMSAAMTRACRATGLRKVSLLRMFETGVGLTADESAKDGGEDTTPLRFTVGLDY